MSRVKKKVIVLGAGIAGLTVAHELIRCKREYEIHVYDRNDSIGGMARSGSKQRHGINLPTEYSWRIYGPNYHNLREIFQQIPLNSFSDKTVSDNLIDVKDYLIADKDAIFCMNNRPKTLWDMRQAFKAIPFKQKWGVFKKVMYCFMISTKRLNQMDNKTWNNYIDPNGTLCHDMRKYIIDVMAPFLGAEALRVNVPSTVKTLESFKPFNRPISVMNAPTNIAWFDHWQSYLENQGVQFHLNATITDIQTENNKVINACIDNKKIIGDEFFCCLSVESVAKMPSLNLPGIAELANKAMQLMVGMQLYFNKKIPMPDYPTILYIPDSPWLLVIAPQGHLWKKSYADVADFWSIGLCNPIRPGLLIKKPFINCTHDEIQQEVWHQIRTSKLANYLSLNTIEVMDYNVWHTYKFNGQILETYEPKFSTNQGTHFLRPNNSTPFANLYYATAYTKTDTDMFEMEGAVESGRRAARLLDKSVQIIPSKRPIFFAPYRFLDKLFKASPYQYVTIGWLIIGLPFAVIYSIGSLISKKIPIR